MEILPLYLNLLNLQQLCFIWGNVFQFSGCALLATVAF